MTSFAEPSTYMHASTTPDPITMEMVWEQLQKQEAMLRLLVRAKVGDKTQLLADEVKLRGRLNVMQVINYLNLSRPTALAHMRKVAKMPGFYFRPGQKQDSKPSILVYSNATLIQEQDQKLNNLFNKNLSTPLLSVCNTLQVSLMDAREICTDFCKRNSGFEFQENKVISVGGKQ